MAALQEHDIAAWVGATSLERGRSYYRNGAVFDVQQQGSTLKARCRGSLPEPYSIAIELNEDEIVEAICSCPVGGAGRCKHVAAVLLTIAGAPDQVPHVPDLATVLDRLSKEQLVTLVRWMVERYPDLQALLALPLPGATAKTAARVAPDAITRQVNAAFARASDDWRAASTAAASLRPLLHLADEYKQADDYGNACLVYEYLAAGVRDNYDEFSDEDGALAGLLNDCVDGLADCFVEIADHQERQTILSSLFTTYRWDHDHGGIDVGGAFPALILSDGSDEERRLVAGWVRQQLDLEGGPRANPDQSTDSYGSYARRRWGSLLLDLEGDRMDDETYLATARATGLQESVVERLLARGRTEEALADVSMAPDYELLRLAPVFAEHGLIARIESMARLRSQNDPQSQLLPWLQQRARERGDMAEALTLTRTLFQHSHSLQYCQELKEIAQALGSWPEEWTGLLAHLENGRHFDVLTEIYLAEGDIDAALRTLGRIEQPRWGWDASHLPIKVAEAAEDKRPRESIRLYIAHVERLIAYRNRGAYAEAAQYLLRVRGLLQKLGKDDTVARLMADLRANNPRLRALHDEMKRAGL